MVNFGFFRQSKIHISEDDFSKKKWWFVTQKMMNNNSGAPDMI